MSLTAMAPERSVLPETLSDTLIERVEKIVDAHKRPLLSTTPNSDAVRELAARTEALEEAVREIALEVQKRSTQS
jgi:hypothetical protein